MIAGSPRTAFRGRSVFWLFEGLAAEPVQVSAEADATPQADGREGHTDDDGRRRDGHGDWGRHGMIPLTGDSNSLPNSFCGGDVNIT